ncbi:MAG: hypothetical protein ACRD0J_03440 [Acidimicrobiales bacterium]
MTKLPVVVALDVDGVLNVLAERATHPARKVHIDATVVPNSPFVSRPGPGGMSLRLRLNPVDGEWITALRQQAQVVWATTWEDLANTVVAPLLGIEPLEVGVRVADHPPHFGQVRSIDSVGWKQEALSERYHGRPLAFIDDGAWTATVDTGAPSLVLAPDPAIGLTEGHRTEVDRFIEHVEGLAERP